MIKIEIGRIYSQHTQIKASQHKHLNYFDHWLAEPR